jgi:hypothetical protein
MVLILVRSGLLDSARITNFVTAFASRYHTKNSEALNQMQYRFDPGLYS